MSCSSDECYHTPPHPTPPPFVGPEKVRPPKHVISCRTITIHIYIYIYIYVCIYIYPSHNFLVISRLLHATAYGCDVALAAQQPSQEVLLLCIDVLRKPTATRPHRQHSTAGHSWNFKQVTSDTLLPFIHEEHLSKAGHLTVMLTDP